MSAFDPTALTTPVSSRAVREWAARTNFRAHSPAATVLLIVVASILGLGGLVVLIAFGLSALAAPSGTGLLAMLPAVLFTAVAIVLIVVLVATTRAAKTRAYRLAHFAEANALHFLARVDAPRLPGMIFTLGSDRYALDVLRGERPRFVEFASYRFTTGSGKNKSVHTWNYIAVHLDVPLPHIVLDATSNNSLFGSNLPLAFRKEQRLGLEGDFDRHFSLYCPSGYEADALYLFTPDIMARFIDNAAALDVEIVDDWLFFYDRTGTQPTDPAAWAWKFSVVQALLDKLDQWARWRDDRLQASPMQAVGFVAPSGVLTPPVGVAHEGQRLRRGIKATTWISVGVVVLYGLLQFFDVFSTFR